MMLMLALVLSLGCVLPWYLCSTQQRWLAQPLAKRWRVLAWVLALGGLVAWINAAGTGAGVAACLTTVMLGCVTLPYLVWWRVTASAKVSP